jgi:hypothetical protein
LAELRVLSELTNNLQGANALDLGILRADALNSIAAPGVVGQQEAADSFKKTREGLITCGKEVERSAKGATEGLAVARKAALSIFTIFTTGKGIQQFIPDLTTSTFAAANLANVLGSGLE